MSRCPVFDTTDLIGKEWTLVVLQEVALNGEKGFNFIFNRMKKISPKLLSLRLKELEADGIIQKELNTDKIPVRTKYRLTEKGEELYKITENLKMWHMKYCPHGTNCTTICAECPMY